MAAAMADKQAAYSMRMNDGQIITHTRMRQYRKIECRSNGQHRTIDMSESGIVHSDWYSTFNGLIKIFAPLLLDGEGRQNILARKHTNKNCAIHSRKNRNCISRNFCTEKVLPKDDRWKNSTPNIDSRKNRNDICLLHHSTRTIPFN